MSEEAAISFDGDGLIPAVVQDSETNQVLMLAWMDRSALERTLASGRVTFWSRSRQELWVKGETSGNYLDLVSIEKNCEANSLLVKVRPHGPACHTGHQTCYYRTLDAEHDLPAVQ